MNHLLITGAAGFIGYHLSKKLLEQGHPVLGVDNLNDYYSPALKRDRLNELEAYPDFKFIEADLADPNILEEVGQNYDIGTVIHLAAQAGVRYSLTNPRAYIKSNLEAFGNVLEFGRHRLAPSGGHLVYASSSSVYGANTLQPYSEHHGTHHPVSLYSATKRSNELMAHAYAHLYGLPVTGLRFFTVYGPWGRPDMAYFKFARAIRKGEPIQVYNEGDMYRDFTYIDDVVEAIACIKDQPPKAELNWKERQLQQSHSDPATSYAPFRIFNIGNNAPVHLMEFIETLEKHLGQEAQKDFRPMQPGDVHKTWADSSELYEAIGFHPQTSLEEGIGNFVEWFNWYYGKDV